MKNKPTDYAVTLFLMLGLLMGMAWVSGVDLEGSQYSHWQDPFIYDHPENFTHRIARE
jgi:hypothetical protein